MDAGEFSKTWKLLGELFPASPRRSSEMTRKIWSRILEPYALDDVTEAILAFARHSKYFPDPAEITAGLSDCPVEPEPEQATAEFSFPEWMTEPILDGFRRFSEQYAGEYHAAGALSLREAEANGLSMREWINMCEKAFTKPGHPPTCVPEGD